MPTAIVTGGAGFIGSHLAERFLREGWTVHVIDNLVTGKRENLPADASFHELDIRDPKAADLIASTKPDVLAHLAAQMDVRRSVEDPAYDASVNVLGSLNLLEAVRTRSPKTRVVFASTGGALYGDNTTPPNFEDFTKDPESPYAISKLTVEHYFGYYGRVHKLDCVAMRFGNVYGPRQDPHGEAGVVAIFCGRILHGKALTVFGDGMQTRDYVFVGDVARGDVARRDQAAAAGGPARRARRSTSAPGSARRSWTWPTSCSRKPARRCRSSSRRSARARRRSRSSTSGRPSACSAGSRA